MRHLAGTRSTGFWGKFFGTKSVFALVLGLGWMVMAGIGSSQVEAADLLKAGFLEEPKTLNIMRASDRWSRRVLSLIYQSLYVRHPETLELVPWLAAEAPVYDAADLCYTVKLRPAKWSDGSEFTAADVAFTARLIQEFKVSRYLSKWKFVERIETPDKHTLKFYLTEPMAIFESRTLITPIVPKKQWEAIAEKARNSQEPRTTFLNANLETPIGTGPFVLQQWRQGAYLYLKRNEHFFGKGQTIQGRQLGPHIDGIIFKFFGTSDAAVMALRKGALDMFWWGIQPGYLDELKRDDAIKVFSNQRSALYYLGFNVRRAPFNDRNLRQAIATLIDKGFIIERILQGHGSAMRSFIPSANTFWHCSEVPAYGMSLSRAEKVRAAYKILREAGYTWETPPVNEKGELVKGEGLRMPDGEPLPEFTILTPPADYDPLRAISGIMIQGWLRDVGMPASARPMAFSALLDQVKKLHKFDAFILAYGRLDIDPAWLRAFFHSGNDKPRGWNMSGYRNPDFDSLAEASDRAVDPAERRDLVRNMQKMLLRDVPYIPLYNPEMIEAVHQAGFDGWVNMLEGIGNIWSFCEVKPR